MMDAVEQAKKPVLPSAVVAGGLAVVLVGALAALLGWLSPSNPAPVDPLQLLTALVGVAVGATEMMARYRDRPFAPLASWPGVIYIAVNGGAAALAFYLVPAEKLGLSDELHVLTAGLGAMALFRSGLFTVRIGDEDVAVGPNLILQILLQALDRAYDRARAVPRATRTNDIMRGLAFDDCKGALPAICFNLMQNVSEEEQAALAEQIKHLDARTDIPAETKSLVLGLALLNIVGEHTLDTAVKALGNVSRSAAPLDPDLLLLLAKLDPQKVVDLLPGICNVVCHADLVRTSPENLVTEISAMPLQVENKAALMLVRLTQVYNKSTVAMALRVMV